MKLVWPQQLQHSERNTPINSDSNRSLYYYLRQLRLKFSWRDRGEGRQPGRERERGGEKVSSEVKVQLAKKREARKKRRRTTWPCGGRSRQQGLRGNSSRLPSGSTTKSNDNGILYATHPEWRHRRRGSASPSWTSSTAAPTQPSKTQRYKEKDIRLNIPLPSWEYRHRNNNNNNNNNNNKRMDSHWIATASSVGNWGRAALPFAAQTLERWVRRCDSVDADSVTWKYFGLIRPAALIPCNQYYWLHRGGFCCCCCCCR